MTPPTPPPLIEIDKVIKSYQGLRPLRVARLQVRQGDQFVLSGFDAAAAEVFVHLVTGAAVPDEGDVRVAGHNTRAIATDTEWLSALDRFGIVTERAVLLDGMSVAANLALPLTLAIDPMDEQTRAQVAGLAADAGLPLDRLDVPVASVSPEERVRIHLGRALGARPSVLLLEHPTARLGQAGSAALGKTLGAIAASRRFAYVALSEDDAFARASGGTRLRLRPATGELTPERFWKRLLS